MKPKRRTLYIMLAPLLLSAGARADASKLAAGFAAPPGDCRPHKAWYLGKAFADTLAKCPQEIRTALARALADGGVSTTPEEIKRMIAWQALADAAVLTRAAPDVKAPDQPYGALAAPLDDFAARIVYVFSKTKPQGGVFTQARAAHGITLYPPAPA